MVKVYNYSRHELTKDQLELLKEAIGEFEVSKPLNPTFRDGRHLKEEIQDKTVSLVAPFNLFFDALLEGLTANIISWHADIEARKKGYFATNKCTIYFIAEGEVVARRTYTLNHKPTEAVDFRTGEKRNYSEVVGS